LIRQAGSGSLCQPEDLYGPLCGIAQNSGAARTNDRGKAEPGAYYKSRLHKIDNLQAAHTYCNQRKANKPEITKWRHETMPPLTVADSEDGPGLVLPANSAS